MQEVGHVIAISSLELEAWVVVIERDRFGSMRRVFPCRLRT